MNSKLLTILREKIPGAEPEVSGSYPTCSEEKCKSYDGKRCRLTGFRPGGTCEPAMSVLGDILESFIGGHQELDK